MMARQAGLHGPGMGPVPPPGTPGHLGAASRLAARRGGQGAVEFRDRLVDYQGNMRDMITEFNMNRRDALQDLHGV